MLQTIRHPDTFLTPPPQNMGVFGLLRPALICCDKDRPDDTSKYLAEFLSVAIKLL